MDTIALVLFVEAFGSARVLEVDAGAEDADVDDVETGAEEEDVLVDANFLREFIGT